MIKTSVAYIGLLLMLSSCASVTSLFDDASKVPEQTVIANSSKESFDYQRFAQRRENAREQLKALGRVKLAQVDDPTFPLAVGNVAVISDPVLEQGLKQELSELLKYWPHQAPAINIAVTDGEPFHAQATQGGSLVINSGVLEGTEFIDEVAFVIAHEAAHVLLDHFKAQEDQEKFEKSVIFATQLLAALDEQRGQGNLSEGAAKTLAGIVTANAYLFGPAFDRKQEVLADFLAVDLLVQRGYSLDGATKVLQRLTDDARKQQELLKAVCGDENTGLSLFLAQALKLERQEGKIREEIAQKDPICHQEQNLLTVLFSQDTHPQPEKRLIAVEEYIRTHYANIDLRRLQSDAQGNNMLNILSPKGAVARSRLAAKAIQALNAGNIELAEQLAKDSLIDQNDTTPKPRYAMYKVRKEQYLLKMDERLLDLAIKNLEIAANGDYAIQNIYLTLADEYAARQDYTRALETLTDSANRFGNKESYYPLQIEYHYLAQQPEQLEQVIQDCQESKDRDLIARCENKLVQLRAMDVVVN